MLRLLSRSPFSSVPPLCPDSSFLFGLAQLWGSVCWRVGLVALYLELRYRLRRTWPLVSSSRTAPNGTHSFSHWLYPVRNPLRRSGKHEECFASNVVYPSGAFGCGGDYSDCYLA